MLMSLYVDNFRAMKNLEIPLGSKVTAIAGQNATCKSTLLGMIGQPFGLKKAKTIFGRSFSTKFSEIFKWSRTYDKPKEHLYHVKFSDTSLCGKETEVVQSFSRTSTDASHIRLVTGAKRGSGDGNIDYPVIYLGLRRVFPLGELKDIAVSPPTLNSIEIVQFNKWYRQVFVPLESVTPIQITSSHGQKDTFAVNAESYDYYANSAGQDNLGQILGAILSFQRLSTDPQSQYRGGILLIDEIDATLFPAAQVNLVDLFFTVAADLKLQFAFTTQSIELLDHLSNKRCNEGEARVLYFDRSFGRLELHVDPSVDWIRSNLQISTLANAARSPKLDVYCEDAEGAWFAKKLLGRRTAKRLNFIKAALGAGQLKVFSRKLPALKDSVIVLDGDQSAMGRMPKNVVCLPGGASPERVFLTLLSNLAPDDEFWHNPNGYNKPVFLNSSSEVIGGTADRTVMKRWFKSERVHWGRDGGRAFQCWMRFDGATAVKFVSDFDAVYNDIAKRKSIPPLD